MNAAAATSAPPLRATDLSWGYAAQRPLGAALQLDLEAGEALAVVGPNGAGKTALLRTLAGALAPLQGSVLLGDAPAHGLPPAARARRAALLPQSLSLDLDLTAAELVALGRTAHLGAWGRLRPADHEAIAAALAACALADHAPRRLAQLSGGERQRAQIAMTLAQRAPLLLLDEPTNHLDLRRRHELFELLRRLRGERPLAVVLVLQDLGEAFAECERVLLVAEGGHAVLRAGEPDARERLAAAFGVPAERIPRLD